MSKYILNEEIVEKLLKDYENKYSLYSSFSSALARVLEEVLKSENIIYHSIESRAKSQKSLRNKLESGIVNPKYLGDVQDLSGVRIIAYVNEDISKIEELISKNFDIKVLEVESKLGTDKVGYRSHHWKVSLSSLRLSLPEYIKFGGLYAELQVRTILQHAWAQIGHNQVYKPNVLLPDKIKRDFTLLSGLLEIADNEFGRISQAITNYSVEVEEKTLKGDLEVSIDSISLRAYFDKRFGSLNSIEKIFGPNDDMTELIIEELSLMDINSLRQLDDLIPKDFDDILNKTKEYTNYCGVARNIMVIIDPEKYKEKAWRKKWVIGPHQKNLIYEHYDIDLKAFYKSA